MNNEMVLIPRAELTELIQATVKNVINELQATFSDRANKSTTNNPDDLLTQHEVCKLLNISVQTLIRHKRNGLISDVKIGRKSYFKRSEITKLIGG